MDLGPSGNRGLSSVNPRATHPRAASPLFQWDLLAGCDVVTPSANGDMCYKQLFGPRDETFWAHQQRQRFANEFPSCWYWLAEVDGRETGQSHGRPTATMRDEVMRLTFRDIMSLAVLQLEAATRRALKLSDREKSDGLDWTAEGEEFESASPLRSGAWPKNGQIGSSARVDHCMAWAWLNSQASSIAAP